MGGLVALETLGCKLNQAETESLWERFLLAGYQRAEAPEGADVYVLNTCTVTHIADRKARQFLRRAHRRNPRALIVATGCYAERAPGEVSAIAGVGLVIGNRQKEELVQAVVACRPNKETGLASFRPHTPLRVRAFLKIQEGCNNFCTYCIVPQVRGDESSLPAEEVVAQVRARVVAGFPEVVLTGTQIGAYGRKEGTSLAELLRGILEETPLRRLRLSSLQPQDLTHELIALWRDGRLCPHLHIPLQSGSETVLRRMGRRYSLGKYREALERVREAIPEVAITTDIMVGFPGETEAEFEESYRFCEGAGFAGIHVFPYSPRPGTAAARMPCQVDEQSKKGRAAIMLGLAARSARAYQERFLGCKKMVLWEREVAPGLWSGLTENYLRIYARSESSLMGRLLPVQLTHLGEEGLSCKLSSGE